ncbi:UPF0149 family protein [Mesorhizobium sp. M0030]|uniref:UPF0149 family protein n=1 Tax=Mesorhizobium sp. M0030 TaxID=2956851 RepID=UPI003338D722
MLNNRRIDLRSYLESGNAPQWGMGISVLDGFLAGVACSPEKIDATQWLPSVWGELTPEDNILRSLWPNNDPVDQRMHEVTAEQVLARHNEIVQLLESDVSTIEPIFSEQKEGHGRAEKWCFGFMEAIQTSTGLLERYDGKPGGQIPALPNHCAPA